VTEGPRVLTADAAEKTMEAAEPKIEESLGVSLYELYDLEASAGFLDSGSLAKIQPVVEELKKARAWLAAKDMVTIAYRDKRKSLPIDRLTDHYALRVVLEDLGLAPSVEAAETLAFLLAHRTGPDKIRRKLEHAGVETYTEALAALVAEREAQLDVSIPSEDLKTKDQIALYLALRVLRELVVYYKEPKEGSGKGLLLVFQDGIYKPGETAIEATANRIATELGIVEKLTKSVRANMLDHIRDICYLAKKKRDLKRGSYLAFENGILDVDEFIETGRLELKPFDPNLYVLWKIPHPLDIEVYDSLSPEAKEDPVKALREIDPWLYERMREWVDIDPKELLKSDYPSEDVELYTLIRKAAGGPDQLVRLLLQVKGNALDTRTPIRFDFMTLFYAKETMTGKGTALEALESMVGRDNVASIPLQELADDEFSRITLLGRLVNIYSDLPDAPVKNQGVLKQIISGEPITANVKHRARITFRPVAKHFYSCNKLPRPNDLSDIAYFRRILVIPFLRKFGRNNAVKEEIKKRARKLLIPCLVALRDMVLHGPVIEPLDMAKKLQEFWKLKTDPIYRFLKDMEEAGILARDTEARIEDNDLLELYNTWADSVGERTLDMRELTRTLQRHNIRKVRIHGQGYYKGLKLLKPKDEAKRTLEEFIETLEE